MIIHLNADIFAVWGRLATLRFVEEDLICATNRWAFDVYGWAPFKMLGPSAMQGCCE